jgi:hypothetical protein
LPTCWPGAGARGHQHLFGPAITLFEWHTDRPRLRAYGYAGTVIDHAIGELEVHLSQPDTERAAQRAVIRHLRTGRGLSRNASAHDIALMEQVTASYPNWLHVVADAANARQWRDADDGTPRKKRPSRRARKIHRIFRRTAIALLVLVVGGLGAWTLIPEDAATTPTYTRPAPVVAPPIDAPGRTAQGTLAVAAAPATAPPSPARPAVQRDRKRAQAAPAEPMP